jgi:hypothetical protein
MKPYYVLLTGSKNNAGDFLIKRRAKKLFASLRPDRELIDFNAWEPFDHERLNAVNEAKALILLGGPSLQYAMRPAIYPMTEDLEAITAPIIGMGIGWKSLRGEWRDTFHYPLSTQTLDLLDRINRSGYSSSVRDFHTLNVLEAKGYSDVLMTGCPAYYDLESLNREPVPPKRIKKVAFSLGVSFQYSSKMLEQMRQVILRLRDLDHSYALEVVFHHSLDAEHFLGTYHASARHVRNHNLFADWLTKEGIAYSDISGSAETLIDYYSSVDIHIGYRVHAHIFMNSISKPSILLAEDGRGKATRDVIGGIVIDAFSDINMSLADRVMRKLSMGDLFETDETVITTVEHLFEYERKTNFNRSLSTRARIDSNFAIMRQFLEQLP